MQGMNMKIIYTPVHPDEKSCDVCFISVEIPSFSPIDIRQKTAPRSRITKIVIALESQDLTELTRWSERRYLLSNGVLYRHNPDLDNEEAQLVTPVQCREEILKQYHDSDVAGHYGVDRILFHWNAEATNLKPSEFLQTPAPAQRFEIIADKHDTWDIHLESIRFAINSTVCESTSRTPAFLTFGREIRAPHDFVYDLRQIVNAENFVPRISPYLHKLSDSLCEAQEVLVEKQDKRKEVADRHRKNICFNVGDKVLVKTHTLLSNVQKGYTNKFSTKRDGSYVITKMVTPTTYEISTMDEDPTTLGKYHVSDIYPFYANENSTTPKPVEPKRKRGRPKKKKT
ncbi:hypothetical protein NQ317_004882 [Molorchus minor]|uniref:Polyprotein n=1 Tax=Molorchus minor TaxID=1323400 RepID=A0ABQ9IQ59_9CUCU|nr:hypothetical protein NQ317_004882 [Molorchus minor]